MHALTSGWTPSIKVYQSVQYGACFERLANSAWQYIPVVHTGMRTSEKPADFIQ